MKFIIIAHFCLSAITVTAAAFTRTTTTTTLRKTSTSTSPRSLSSSSSSSSSSIPFHRSTIAVRYDGSSTTTRLYLSESSSDDDEPLSRGVDSVSWLPSVNNARSGQSITITDDSIDDETLTTLPLFPLGGIVYTPNSQHVLNIFEPRYRQMYNDILMNGSKRFVVCMSHPSEGGRFAQMGVLFQLEDLKEVSEQTNDQVKYICNHKVMGRVKLKTVLNPHVWGTRETYLKVEGVIINDVEDENEDDDDDDDEEMTTTTTTIKPGAGDIYSQLTSSSSSSSSPSIPEESNLRSSFSELVELQHELNEDVRFTRASVETLSVSPGSGEESLWTTVRLWQSYSEQRLVARQNELQKEFQDKLLKYLTKEKGVKEEELPSAIGFRDLSPALQKEVQELQNRMSIELQPLILESTLTMQKILEAPDHKERLELLRYFVDAEKGRLAAKKTLRGMFKGGVEEVEEEDEGEDNGRVEGKILKDEPDAFQ